MRVPKVLLPPPKKLDIWPKNGQIWPITGIFGQISAFLAHLIQCLTKKQIGKVAQVVLHLHCISNNGIAPKTFEMGTWLVYILVLGVFYKSFEEKSDDKGTFNVRVPFP